MAPREARIEFDGGVVCERCIVADSFRLRLRGLLGRRTLGSDEGLLLVGSPSIHTTLMHFPIDVLFLNRELGVIAVKEGLKPWRSAGRLAAAGRTARTRPAANSPISGLTRPTARR